jgi:hypothetical protein
MREAMVRVSLDIPQNEHMILKKTCVQANVSIKDFVHSMILRGIHGHKKDTFKKRLRESVDQAKDGKGRIISSKELDEMVKE